MGIITGSINLTDAIFEVKLAMRSVIRGFENDLSQDALFSFIHGTKGVLQMSVYFMDENYFNRYCSIICDVHTAKDVDKVNIDDLKALQADIEKIPHRQ